MREKKKNQMLPTKTCQYLYNPVKTQLPRNQDQKPKSRSKTECYSHGERKEANAVTAEIEVIV